MGKSCTLGPGDDVTDQAIVGTETEERILIYMTKKNHSQIF